MNKTFSRFFIIFILLLLTSCLVSCSARFGPRTAPERAVDDAILETQAALPSKNFKISKSKVKNVIKKSPKLNSLRMVSIFSPDKAPPSYRLFEIKPGGVYDMLGLRNKDVLVAVEKHVVYDRTGFVRYVEYLSNLDQSYLHVKRAGKDLLLKYELF